eukprot:7391952-Prymnesium_polylepis.2
MSFTFAGGTSLTNTATATSSHIYALILEQRGLLSGPTRRRWARCAPSGALMAAATACALDCCRTPNSLAMGTGVRCRPLLSYTTSLASSPMRMASDASVAFGSGSIVTMRSTFQTCVQHCGQWDGRGRSVIRIDLECAGVRTSLITSHYTFALSLTWWGARSGTHPGLRAVE